MSMDEAATETREAAWYHPWNQLLGFFADATNTRLREARRGSEPQQWFSIAPQPEFAMPLPAGQQSAPYRESHVVARRVRLHKVNGV